MTSIPDKIMEMFSPLVDYSSKSYDNNYMLYFGFGAFALLILVILYVFLKVFKVL